MNTNVAQTITHRLLDTTRVVDVGGGASPFARADYVLDAVAYDQRSKLGIADGDAEERFSMDSWVQVDLCDRKPWPFEDNFFDFAVCSHLLEDVRDPIWVCSEICRIAKAGYVETPSRFVKQSKGVEHPLYAGFYHHRWLVSHDEQCLTFRFKPHSLHTIDDAVVANVGVGEMINPRYEATSFEWKDCFEYKEILEFDEGRVSDELCSFASRARELQDLLVPNGKPMIWKLRKWLYYRRLRKRRR